ncbi:MAG: PepSY domain-containing protein [Bauldia sp.]
MRKTFVITTLVVAAASIPFLGAGVAIGQVAGPAPAAAATAGWLGAGEIAARLNAAGWTILKLEAEPNDANYKVCGVAAGGPQIEARVDPLTGAILTQEAKDCIGGGRAAATAFGAMIWSSSDDSHDDHSFDVWSDDGSRSGSRD